MRKSRFTEAQIIGMIKEQEAGMPTAEAKTLNAREVLFEAYLALIWLSADIGVFTYKDFLEYVAEMNTRYLAKINKQITDAKAELKEEGTEIADEWKVLNVTENCPGSPINCH